MPSSRFRFPTLDGVVGSGLAAAVREAAAVLVPVSCAGCDRPDTPLCRECRAACAPAVRRVELGRLHVHAGLEYAGPVARIVRAFKDSGRTGLSGALAPAFRDSVQAAMAAAESAGAIGGREPPLLVAVPDRRASLRARGYRPVRRLADRAGVRVSRGLRFARQPRDQRSLGRRARLDNVGFAMVADRSVRGTRVIVIDDVLTTGATMTEAARAISAAGGEVVGAAVLARTAPGRRIAGVATGGALGFL